MQQRHKELRFKGAATSGKKGAFNKTVMQTFGLEVAKRAVTFSIGLRGVSEWTLWRGRSPGNERTDVQSTALQKDDDGGTPVTYSG
jgi:hypothetical protein